MKYIRSMNVLAVTFALISSLICVPLLSAVQSIYSDIATSYTVPREGASAGTGQGGMFVTPTYDRSKSVLFDLFARYGCNTQLSHVIDQRVWKDLELFSSGESFEKNGGLFAQLSRAHTLCGEVALARMVADPTANVTLIKSRQAFIKRLVSDDVLFETLQHRLSVIAKVESSLMGFWTNELAKFHSFFFSNRGFFASYNKSALALDLANVKDQLIYGLVFGFLCMVPFIVKNATNRPGGLAYSINFFSGSNLSGQSGAKAMVYWVLLNFLLEALVPVDHMIDARGLRGPFSWLMCAAAAVVSLLNGVEAKESYVATQKSWLSMQSALIDAARFFDTVKAVRVDGEALPEMNAAIDLSRIEVATKHLAAAGSQLATSTFSGKPSVFSRRGRVLATFQHVHEAKRHLMGLFEVIGELDAHVSIARLYRQHRNKQARYTFVDFVQHHNGNGSPQIDLEEFWNPHLDANDVVTNSLALGRTAGDLLDGGKSMRKGSPPRATNIVVTGPNAGGKSTVLKAVALNCILAQSFGIMAASKATITPFSRIVTHLNIADDIGSGVSHFKAEILRTKEVLRQVAKQGQNNCSLVIMDEVFNGTSPREGAAAAYALGHKLASMRGCISLLATHFNKVTQLEKNDGLRIKNYHVSVTKKPDGNLHYPFKLFAGPADQNIAFDMLINEGVFDQSVYEQAQEAFDSLEGDGI